MSDLSQRFAEIQERIQQAARRAGRDPAEIRLLAVSKTFPVEAVAEAAALGQVHFGENYVQEAQSKVEHLPHLDWHLIGHLQSNKAMAAARLFSSLHSLDRLSLAQRLDKAAWTSRRRLKCFLQIHLGEEESKSGLSPRGLIEEIACWPRFEFIELVGLMCIPPAHNPRPHFAQLRQLAEALYVRGLLADRQLSMGMSDDFEEAIAEGSHWIRIGRALFGSR